MYVFIYILVWTRAYPCTEQGRAERCATEWSVREHRLFEQLPRTWLRMPFRARLGTFMPSYSAASRLYVLAGERIQIRSQPRRNIGQNIPEKSIPKSMKINAKSMKIGSWSHIGSRWHLLGAILAQDDPEDWVFIDFYPILRSPKCFKIPFKNETIFRHLLKPCFLLMELTNAPKWRCKTTPQKRFLCTGPKLENRALAQTRA